MSGNEIQLVINGVMMALVEAGVPKDQAAQLVRRGLQLAQSGGGGGGGAAPAKSSSGEAKKQGKPDGPVNISWGWIAILIIVVLCALAMAAEGGSPY